MEGYTFKYKLNEKIATIWGSKKLTDQKILYVIFVQIYD